MQLLWEICYKYIILVMNDVVDGNDEVIVRGGFLCDNMEKIHENLFIESLYVKFV